MVQYPKNKTQSMISPASQMAFAVAACALAAAGIGIIVNHWLTGWMAVGGMTGVGLFYTAIGLLNLRSSQHSYDDKANGNASERAARSDNLIGEVIPLPTSGSSRFFDARQFRSRSEATPVETDTPLAQRSPRSEN